jgi:hypothetical protein
MLWPPLGRAVPAAQLSRLLLHCCGMEAVKFPAGASAARSQDAANTNIGSTAAAVPPRRRAADRGRAAGQAGAACGARAGRAGAAERPAPAGAQLLASVGAAQPRGASVIIDIAEAAPDLVSSNVVCCAIGTSQTPQKTFCPGGPCAPPAGRQGRWPPQRRGSWRATCRPAAALHWNI